MTLSSGLIDTIITRALEEDIGKGDITSQVTLPKGAMCRFAVVTREAIAVSGVDIAMRVFSLARQGEAALVLRKHYDDGAWVEAGAVLLEGEGDAALVFRAERVALNLLQHLCGIATLTHAFVKAVAHTKAVILDTRKTTPGLREFEKYAVRCGGAKNQRMRLDDAILIKDNHIAVCGGVKQAVASARAKAPKGMVVEVECDRLDQLEDAVEAKADIALLDNMSVEQLREAVSRAHGKIGLEASGNVSLETVAVIAETGVDYISVGRITHSARNVDIGLDMVMG
jgi:nicotinate-nucleotide pyrophosphorylase (carboxylating)